MSPSIVQRLKRSESSSNTIKVKCKDAEGNEVTEYLPIVGANDPLEFLLDLWDEANVLEERYGLISEGKMKFLLQSVGRALQGRYAKKWKKFASVISIADSTATRHEATNRGKWTHLLQDVSKAIFMKGAFEDQIDYLEDTKRPNKMDPTEYVERVFTINERLTYFERGASPLSAKQINRKIITKNIGGTFKSKYILQGGDDLDDEDDILDMINKISKCVAAQNEDDESERKQTKRESKFAEESTKKINPNIQQHVANMMESMRKQTKRESKFAEESTKKINPNIQQPCRKHDGKHDWRNCPDNPNNKLTNKTEKNNDNTSESKSKSKPSNSSKQKSEESFATESSSKHHSAVTFDGDFMISDDEQEDEF
eukprot:CAMPEP_0171353774 /NCGR_PEP_ID=MMETSP0878-20121228/44367_1 /TAXON_ID=67004 /ORGANISM="Thalassiosira weissflogii, Strain CCMP1336" /LENGTH=369 /DNA_ID=CAMNT_0011859729 /DNA_START=55 /DNA_END=1165 /DNA_ORIENTATION=+